MVKSLDEKLASVSLTQQENKPVSYVHSREVSLKKKRCVLHEISDSDDARKTSRLMSWMCGLVVKIDKRRMGFKCLHLMTCLLSKVVPIDQSN